MVAVSIYIPTTTVGGSLQSTPFPGFTVCRYFDDDYSDQCEVTPHCSFDLHFSNNQQICMQVRKQQLELYMENRLVPNQERSMSRLYLVTLHISLICRIHHEKCWVG